MTDVKIDEKEITSEEVVDTTIDEEQEEVQTTFNEDSLEDLVEEGEVENVYEN